ncbi:MAG: transglycosylase domain-containing protein [Candidatus Sericytochromatia bacterium]
MSFVDNIKNTFSTIGFKIVFIILGVILSIITLFFLIIYLIYDVKALDSYLRPEPSKLYDTNEQLYSVLDYSQKRKVIPLSKISPYLIKSVISTEDKEFYHHKGFSIYGLGRAILGKGGGSTITQQLARNVFLSSERSIMRKIKEIIIAIKIENFYSKDKILELYLNEIYWGDNGYYGIESVSNYYFGKSAQYLDLYESTLIAGILPAPESWSPRVNFKKAKWRQSLVLENMVKNNYITQNEANIIKNTYRKLAPISLIRKSKYPYFTDYIVEKLEKIDKKYTSEKFLSRGGLKIFTTINQQYQQNAESILREEIRKLRYNNVNQGIIISINPKNGYIRAFVGGKEYKGFNRIFSKRQPGSTFKPFVYLTYFNQFFTSPSDVYPDTLEIATYKNALEVPCKKGDYSLMQDGRCYKDYIVKNYNSVYMGRISLNTAIKQSVNTIPVGLAYDMGIKKVIKTAHDIGISSKLKPELGTVLGGSEVTPFELIKAYCVLANGGYAPDKISPIIKVLDKNNKNIYNGTNTGLTQLYSSIAVYKLNQTLKKVVESGTGTNAYVYGKVIAGKTGTTSNNRDAWFIGYTPSLVTLVWLGNDDNSKMVNITGATCAKIFKKYMESIKSSVPSEYFPEPDNIFNDTYFLVRKYFIDLFDFSD